MVPARVHASLLGLTVGDAFGETFFFADCDERVQHRRIAPRVPGPRHWTDDTAMALGIVEVLEHHGRIDQEELARVFARNYAADPRRGYGGTAHSILREIGEGVPWQKAAGDAFYGQGSMGNGAAMRVAPLGAWFAEDLSRVVSEALASAAPTHAHADGGAGAVAVAVATAVAATGGTVDHFWAAILDLTPEGETRRALVQARLLTPGCSVLHAISVVGNGRGVISSDTVPFVIWSAALAIERNDSFEEALWRTVEGLGDRDTTCAMVGGILGARLGADAIPAEWRDATESWPAWGR